jgi:hypothetical protein
MYTLFHVRSNCSSVCDLINGSFTMIAHNAYLTAVLALYDDGYMYILAILYSSFIVLRLCLPYQLMMAQVVCFCATSSNKNESPARAHAVESTTRTGNNYAICRFVINLFRPRQVAI